MWLVVFSLFLKYFIFTGGGIAPKQGDISGQKFAFPTSSLEMLLPDRDVRASTEDVANDELVSIATPLADYSFSTVGGSLVQIDYKDHKDRLGLPIQTVSPAPDQLGSLLLAFEGQSPLDYKIAHADLSHAQTPYVEFETDYQGWRISKRFMLDVATYAVKLTCDFTKVQGDAPDLLPRVFFVGPYSPTFVKEEVVGVVNEVSLRAVDKVVAKDEELSAWKLPKLFGAEDKYFLNAYVGGNEGSLVRRSYFDRVSHSRLISILELHQVSESSTHELQFYFGPKAMPAMAAVDPLLVDTLSLGFLSWLCKLLIKFLEGLYSFVGNYGFVIMLLTLLIKVPFLPLFFYARRKSEDSNLFEKAYAREIAAINRQHSNDMVAKSQALSDFYSSHGHSQYGKMTMIIPTLLQLPIVFSLYRVLGGYIALHNAPFVLWVTDLSVKDPYFVLPVLLGLASYLQQGMSQAATGADVGASKFMRYALPVFLMVIFSSLPAGLVLYWLCNSLASVGEELLFSLLGSRQG